MEDKKLSQETDILSMQQYYFRNLEMFMRSYYIPCINDIIDTTNITLKDMVSMSYEEYVNTLLQRFSSAQNFKDKVIHLGKELFGSAKWEKEAVLAENELFTLNYIPHSSDKQIGSVFMAGGYIPYSDSFFRFSDSRNFYSPFIKSGISVYEMKMKNDNVNNPNNLKLNHNINIETIHKWSDLAFKHNGNRKMVLMGYCGTGIMAMGAYLADLDRMSQIFPVIATFTYPLDAKKCTAFSEIIQLVSEEMQDRAREYYSGEELSSLIDVSLERSHEKTDTGYFMQGWKNKDYYNVKNISDLNERQKIELGMLYWLSAENSGRTPISKELADFMYNYFAEGVRKDGSLPFEYKNKKINLKEINKYDVKAIFFHGDIDNIVPPNAAFILDELLDKNKYERIIHKNTDHISYIFNMKRWDKTNEKAFAPNPIDLMLNTLNKYESYFK